MADVTSLFEKALGSPLPIYDDQSQQGYVDAAREDVGLDDGNRIDILNPATGPGEMSRLAGGSRYAQDSGAARSNKERTGDSALGIMNSLIQGVLGVGGAAAGIVNDDAGTAVAEFADDVNLGQFQSDALHRRQQAAALRDQISQQHNKSLRDREVANGSSEIIADLRRVGRDFIDGFKNGDADGMVTGDTVSHGVGSLLLGGVMGKGLRALGASQGASMMGSIGLLEGGGAYQQTVSEVMMMTHDQLMKGSPEYAEMIQSGITPDEARREIANNAGLLAGAQQSIVGAATGKLVSKFEAAPLARTNIPTLLGNVAKEGLEEGIQSASGALASNIAIDTFADQDRDILGGVGLQTAQGALAGSLTAGIGAPSAVVGSVQDAGKAVKDLGIKAVKQGWNALKDRGERLMDAAAALSPVSKESVDKAVESLRAKFTANPNVIDELELDLASQVEDEADQNDIGDHLQRVKSAMVLDPAEAETETNPVVKAMVEASGDRFEAIRRMSSVALDNEVDPTDRLAAGLYVFRAATQYTELFDKTPEALSKLDKDDPAVQQLNAFSDIAAAIRQDTELRQVVEVAAKYAGELQADDIQTPEQAQVAAEAMDAFPEQATPEVMAKVMEHAEDIPEDRRVRLEATVERLKVEQDLQSEAARLRKDPAQVSQEVLNTANEKNKMPSAHQHMNRILGALRERNSEKAKVYLEDFMDFAEHMNRKVEAYNENFRAGKGSDKHLTQYLQRTPQGAKMTEGKQGVWVNGKTAGSVANAQMVEANAKAVTTLANRLANSLRDLGVKPIEFAQLDEALRGEVDQVVIRNRLAASKQAAEQARNTKPVEEKPESPAQPARKPEPRQDAPAEATETPAAVPAVEPEAKVEKVEEVAEKVQETESKKVEDDSTPVLELTEEVELDPTPEEAPKSGIELAYPGLHQIAGKLKNWFYAVYKTPAKPISRLLGMTNSAQVIYDALQSNEAYQQFLGDKAVGKLSPETSDAYSFLISFFNPIQDELGKRLTKYLAADQSRLDQLVDGNELSDKQITAWRAARVMNLVQQTEDGKFVYQQELMNGAIMAGMSWLIAAQQRQRVQDQEDIAKLLGVSESVVQANPWTMEFFNGGVWSAQAKQDLAQKIKQYWGVQSDRTAPKGYTDGLAEAMAAEVIAAMQVTKLATIEQSERRIEGKTYTRVAFHPATKTDQRFIEMRRFPDILDRLALIEPEPTHFIGSPPAKEDTHQLRNRLVKLKPAQAKMVKRAQNIEHTINDRTLNLFTGWGRPLLKELFGAGTYDAKTANVNYAKSVDSKNSVVDQAMDMLDGLIAATDNLAEVEGKTRGEMKIFYRFGVSKVGRLHMQGAANPQANKLAREVILPTRQTVDLTDANKHDLFMLAIGQHLGVKIHKMSREQAIADTQSKLDALSPIISDMTNWSTKDAAQIKAAFAAADAELSPGSIHALQDYLRAQEVLGTDEASSFETAVYIEADGVTDGPINAMMHMAASGISAHWLKIMAKGGMYVGPDGRAGMTLNQYSQLDKQDLYKETSISLDTRLNDLRAMFLAPVVDGTGKVKAEHSEQGLAQANRLDALLLLLAGTAGASNISFNPETNELEIQRGIVKNPLTVTIYGSGAKGIAGKISGEVLSALYEQLSKGTLSEDTINSFKLLTGVDLATVKGTNFTFGEANVRLFDARILELFVEPMRSAIFDQIGETDRPIAALRDAVQVQSIFMVHAFNDAIERALDRKEKAEKAKNSGWKRHDFLSEEELLEVYEQLKHLAPYVDTGTQSFMMMARKRAALEQKYIFGQGLFGELNQEGFIEGPGYAGVKAIPTMVQGPGDGMMVQNLMLDPEIADHLLAVFDGVNFGLNDIEKSSERVNRAVRTGWLGNPLADVATSFNEFLASVDFTNMNQEMREQLVRALDPEVEFNERKNVSTDEIKGAMEMLGSDLQQFALHVQARHNVLSKVDMSIDHMASVGKPFVQKGSIELQGTTFEALAVELQLLVDDEVKRLSEINDRWDNAIFTSQDITATLGNLGSVDEASGARTITTEEMFRNLRSLNIPREHKGLLRDVLKALNTSSATPFQVVFGSREEVMSHRAEHGLSRVELNPKKKNHGFHVPSERFVYLMTGSSETLVHELIHAATMETLLTYYEGDRSTLNREQIEAIMRIEQLANQWRKEIDFSDMTSPEQIKALRSARSAVDIWLEKAKAGDRGAMAFALNEFMTHNLTSVSLITKNQSVTVTRKAAQLVKSILDGIKQMIWGKHVKIDHVGNDLFSNLRFNTQVLIYSAPGVQQHLNTQAAFHATDENDRLTSLRQSFAGMMGRWVRDSQGVAGLDAHQSISDAVKNSQPLTNSFVTAFRLTKQEARTFETMALAMMTQAEINPNSMSRVQTLYRHVIDQLKVEDLMRDAEKNDPSDRLRAQEKLDTLLGHYHASKDMMGRSSLLPGFLALSMTSDAFREVLQKVSLPKSAKDNSGTADAALDNVGSFLMNELDRTMSGEGRNKHNVRAALDSLVDHIMTSSVREQGAIEAGLNHGVTALGKANQALSEALSKGGHAVYEALDKKQQDATNEWYKKVLEVGKALASVVNEEDGAAIRDGLVAGAMEVKIRELSEMIFEVVGRTEHNALIFDMIKIVRSAVQRGRQQYREQLPKLIASKFKRALTDEEYQAMFHGMARADIAALFGTYSMDKLLKLLAKPGQVDRDIAKIEQRLKDGNPLLADLWIKKSKELSAWSMEREPTGNLLRNALAVSRLFNERLTKAQAGAPQATAAQVKLIDQLVSLYNLQNTKQEVRDTLADLVTEEAEGMEFMLSNLIGQYNDEQAKVDRSGAAQFNHYKGHVITENDGGSSLIVAKDSEDARLRQLGYTRVAAYVGSDAEISGVRRSYFFAPVASRAPFSQGIIQNIRMSASGVDPKTGYSTDPTAGLIDDPFQVRKIKAALRANPNGNSSREVLLPVVDGSGTIIAFERSLDPAQTDRLEINQHMGEVMGIWRGRQLEELRSQEYNRLLVGNLSAMWERDKDSKPEQYIDLYSKEALKDPVIRDAVQLFTPEMHDLIRNYFEDGRFMVSKDLVNNVIGYRNPSVGDAWTGVSRWTPEVRQTAVKVATGILGADAFTKLMKAEKVYQTFITDARVTIVVKSVVVPAANMLSNMVHLLSLNIAPQDIWRGFPRKAAEVDAYLKGRLEEDRLEAELLAAEAKRDLPKVNKLKVDLQSTRDSYRRLSIWPLIERGEFASISDAGVSHEEIDLTEGRLSAYLEQLTRKLPPQMRTMARYGLVAKDTSLFKGLQRAVEYGDFLAKAVLYDDLVNPKGRHKLSQTEALGRITEEFIHYDYLPGRTRTGLENFGVTWFWNYKLRAMKVAINTIRNNPLSVLLAGLLPLPGSIGTPVDENIATIAASGDLGWSLGIGQAAHAHQLNPWFNGLT